MKTIMTGCQLMAIQALKEHTVHYHGAYELRGEVLHTQYLDNYKGRKGFFMKKFLINDKLNLNNWKVTWDAMKNDIWDFVGKPVVLTPDLDHPPVKDQEDYRVGTIIDVGLDEINHIAWQVSEIFDPRAQEMITKGEVEFGSPTVLIRSEGTREQKFKGTPQQQDILHRFVPAHDALVANPAYGKEVNNIPAVCTGDGPACALKLLEVSASVEYRVAAARAEMLEADYATTQRGEHRFPIGSDQDKLLHTRKLAHSHVHIKDGKKTIERWYSGPSSKGSLEAAQVKPRFDEPQTYEEAEYVETEISRQCNTCIYFENPNICNLPIGNPVHPTKGCCRRWNPGKKDEGDIMYLAEVNSDNTNQLTIVPFVRKILKQRFSDSQLANVIHNAQSLGGDDRPPKEWFDRCTKAVREKGTARDPEAVCNVLWHERSGSIEVRDIIEREHYLLEKGIPENIVHEMLKQEFERKADSDSCVSRKIKIIADENPKMPHDQVIAIAYSYCRSKSKEAALEGVFMAELADEIMPFIADAKETIEKIIADLQMRVNSAKNMLKQKDLPQSMRDDYEESSKYDQNLLDEYLKKAAVDGLGE